MSSDSKELAALEVAIAADPAACASLAAVVAALKQAASGGSSTVPISATAAQLIPVAAALAAKPTADGVAKPTADGAGPAVPAVDYKETDVVCKSSTPISFSTPRGKCECKLLSDGRCILEQRTPKGVTAYAVRPEHVRRVMRLDIGDSNNTTYLMVAIDPNHALVAGKQKLQTRRSAVRTRPRRFSSWTQTAPARAATFTRRVCETSRPAGTGRRTRRARCSRRCKTDRVFAGVGGRGCVKANHKFNQGHLQREDEATGRGRGGRRRRRRR